MAKFVPLITWILLSGLLFVVVFMGAVGFQIENQTGSYIGNDSRLNELANSINSSLQSSATNIDSANEAFENSSITTNNLGNPFLDAVGGTWKIIKSTPTTIYNLIAGYSVEVLFGGNQGQLITLIIGTILVLTMIGSIIYLITRGESG